MLQRLGKRLGAVALGIGAAGCIAFELLERTPWRFAEVRGVGWRAVDKAGDRLVVRRDAAGIDLQPGQSIELDFEEAEDRSISAFDVTLERLGDHSFVDLRARATNDGAYELWLGPTSTTGVAFGIVANDGSRRVLHADRETPWIPARSTRFRVAWRAGAGRVAVAIDSRSVFDLADLRPREGRISLTARGGATRVHLLSLVGGDGSGNARLAVSTESLPGVGYSESVATGLAKWAGAVLAVAIGLVAAFQRRFPPRDLIAAIGWGAVPVAGWLVVSLFRGVALDAIGSCASAVVVVVIASLRLRRIAADSAAPPGARFTWVAAASVGAALLSLALEREFALHRSLVDEIRYAEAQPMPPPFFAAGPVELDLANSLKARQNDRDLDLSMTATLAPDSLLELRLHADRSNGVGLFLSSDPRHRTRFVRESESEFTRIGADSGPIAPSRPHHVRVEVRGEDYRAFVDGVLVAEASERRFPTGETVLLAARGSATVSEFSVSGVPGARPRSRAWTDAARAAASSILLAFGYAATAGFLLRRSIVATFVAAGCAMLPAFLAMTAAGSSGAPRGAAIATTVTFFVFATIHAAIAIPGATAARFHTTIFAALGVSLALYLQLDRRFGTPTVDEINRMSILDHDGTRIDPSVVDLEHPLLRRWNFYLRDHEFRGRRFRLAKRSGQFRVIGLGTSSTYGYGDAADWPTLLERELKSEAHCVGDVEVLNAGCSGSTGARLVYFLENTLVFFRPDVVVLSLFHNDSIVLTQFDEPAVLREIVSDRGVSPLEFLAYPGFLTSPE